MIFSNLIARYHLISDQLIRYARFVLFPPTSSNFALVNFPLTSSTPSTQSLLPDTSILLTQKHRSTIERRRIRRHSDLPMSLMIKYGTPRQDLHQCLECGTWHEKKTICGKCYDRIRQETEEMKKSFPNQDEFRYNYPPEEIVYVYKNDPPVSPEPNKRIVEMPRERPSWFSKNLIPKINTSK